MANGTKTPPARPTIEQRMASWSVEQAATAMRLIMMVWLRRRARWNVHKRTCPDCAAWTPRVTAEPVCRHGGQLLAQLRQAVDARKILAGRLDQAAATADTLF